MSASATFAAGVSKIRTKVSEQRELERDALAATQCSRHVIQCALRGDTRVHLAFLSRVEATDEARPDQARVSFSHRRFERVVLVGLECCGLSVVEDTPLAYGDRTGRALVLEFIPLPHIELYSPGDPTGPRGTPMYPTVGDVAVTVQATRPGPRDEREELALVNEMLSSIQPGKFGILRGHVCYRPAQARFVADTLRESGMTIRESSEALNDTLFASFMG